MAFLGHLLNLSANWWTRWRCWLLGCDGVLDPHGAWNWRTTWCSRCGTPGYHDDDYYRGWAGRRHDALLINVILWLAFGFILLAPFAALYFQIRDVG